VDYFDIKGDLELVLALGSGAASFEFVPGVDAQWHPGRSAEIRRDGRRVGVIGALHPRLAKALDLATDVYAFELDLAPVLARGVPRAAEQSRFPLVRRDIAVVLDAAVPFAAVRATVAAAVGPQLRDFVLFDQYAGKGLIEGTRSLAMGLILQDHSRTLTDQDADQAVASSVAALAREFGARLRS
jgi:phenylalanyl-tRNA synthetase beta chain